MRFRALSSPSLLLTVILTAVPLTVALTARDQLSRRTGDIGMSVYEDANFRGRNATFIEDMPDLRSTGLNRKISSIRVASGEIWQVCTERNYGGRCLVVSGTEDNLQRNGWNDTIQSARRVQGNAGNGGFGRGGGIGRGGGGRGGSARPAPGTVELYAGTQYTGDVRVVERAEPNLRRLNFNDRASSIRVAPGEAWEVCVNINYDDCRLIDDDLVTLNALGLNRLVSSLRPRPSWNSGIGRGNGGRAGQRPQAILYDQTNYRGRSILLTGDEPQIRLGSNNNGSLRVIAGRWELCVQPQFGGQCVSVAQNTPDLRSLSLRGRVSSARPR